MVRLLVTQRINRIEVSGFPGGISTENNPHDGADEQTDDDPIHGNHGGPFQKIRSGISADNSEDHTDRAAEFAQNNRLHYKLCHDIALLCTDSSADSYLACALSDGNKHDVHDANPGSEQGNRADKRYPQAHGARKTFELSNHRLVGEDLEIVLLSGRHFAQRAQSAPDLLDSIFVTSLIARLHQNAQAPVPASVAIQTRGDSNNHK